MSADLLFTQQIGMSAQKNTSAGIFDMFGAQDTPDGKDPAAFLKMFLNALSDNNESGDFTSEDADGLIAKLKGDQAHLSANEKKALKSFEDIITHIEKLVPEEQPLEDVDMAVLLAANPELEEDVRHFMKTTQALSNEAIQHTLMLNAMALDEIMIPIGGEAKDSKPEDMVKVKKDEIENGLGTLLSLNLTPKQMAELKTKLEALETQDAKALEEQALILSDKSDKKASGDDTVDAIFSTIVAAINSIKPGGMQPSNGTASPASEGALGEAAARTAAGKEQALQNLGNDNAGGNSETADEQIMKYLDGNFKGSLKAAGDGYQGNASFKAALASNDNSALQSGATPHLPAGTSQASLEALLGSGMLSENGLLGPHNENALFAAGSPNATQMGGLTSLVAGSHGAGHAHPATHMVAVNIQKAVTKGESTNLTLQLDPPELGRVEVKLHFSKDKTLKASMMVEKPETMIMLQRDAQGLERALQDMGLEADGGIDFQLAEQGFDFDQNNQRGGGHDKGGTGAGDAENADDLIETTMTWHVDPESGHTRYDILV